jgi:hypothetical protein
MKFLIPFFVFSFVLAHASQNTDVVSQTDTMTFDSVQIDVPVQDSSINYGPSGYTHLLEIIAEYSFQQI